MNPIEAFEAGKFDEAVIALCNDGVAPFSQDAKRLKAMAVLNKGDRETTKRILDTCSQEDPYVQKMMGYLAFSEDRFEDAVRHYETALALHPGYAEAAHDLGVTSSHLFRHEEAKRYLELACHLKPEWPQAYMDLGIVKLNACDESGWLEYEMRHKARGQEVKYSAPMWNGEDVSGKRFFLLCEQGFGDQIQFLRYAKALADQGAHVLVGVHEKLRRFSCLQAGVREVYVMGHQVAPFDTWVCSMSIPRILGGIGTMGGPSFRMGSTTRGKKVGICWRGNPEHKGDRFRSIPLRAFAPIIETYDCVRVQFDLKLDDLGSDIEDLTVNCFDFQDTAMRMLDELKLLVTCDTGLAHLAGSIGLPTIMLLPEVMDFRWRLKEPSFYYPSMKSVVNRTNWDETLEKALEVSKDMI